MTRIVSVKASDFIRNGKLIAKKTHLRIIPIPTFSTSKKRVQTLRKALDRVRQLTLQDAEQMEYGIAVHKLRKQGRTQINRGKFMITKDGRKIPTVSIPNGKIEKNLWKVHSHPSIHPLSLADILNAKKKGGTVFAITKDGSVFRSTRLLGEGQSNTDKIKKAFHEANTKLEKEGVIEDAILTDQLWSDRPFDIVADEAHSVARHRVLNHLHQKGLIHYRAKLSDEMKGHLKKYKSIMDAQFRRYF